MKASKPIFILTALAAFGLGVFAHSQATVGNLPTPPPLQVQLIEVPHLDRYYVVTEVVTMEREPVVHAEQCVVTQ